MWRMIMDLWLINDTMMSQIVNFVDYIVQWITGRELHLKSLQHAMLLEHIQFFSFLLKIIFLNLKIYSKFIWSLVTLYI